MSPRFWEIFGYTPEEKKHHPSAWQDMIFQEDLPVVMQKFKEHCDSKGAIPCVADMRKRGAPWATAITQRPTPIASHPLTPALPRL